MMAQLRGYRVNLDEVESIELLRMSARCTACDRIEGAEAEEAVRPVSRTNGKHKLEINTKIRKEMSA
jgi:hypothetical protein